MITSEFTCVAEEACYDGTYADSTDITNKICKECLPPCKTCHGKADYCLICTSDSNTFFYNNECLAPENCPEGTYPDSTDPANKLCSPCESPCSSCISKTECTKCNELVNLYLYGN